MQSIFKTKMLIYLSKANLDVKIMFGNIIHLIDPEIRKRAPMGTKIPHAILVHYLLAFEIQILYLCFCSFAIYF